MNYKLKDWTYGKTKEFIKTKTLKSDIARGVKFLSERAYSNACGSTKSSALFCLALKKYIDFSLVYRVDLKQSKRHWYTVNLFTRDGYTIMLKGFSFGYFGEGSRGCYSILKEIGFTHKHIERIFKHEHANTKFMRLYNRKAV